MTQLIQTQLVQTQLVQTQIEDIASLNIPKSQALIDQEHPVQVEGEPYPRRNFVRPELRSYPPFITNLFFSAFVQGFAEDQEWHNLTMDYRSKSGHKAAYPTQTWLSDKSWATIDAYLETNYGTNLALEWFGWHADEDLESLNMEIRQNDKHGRLIMRVHFTPTLVQEGDHVLVGRREFIVDAMDSDNINLLSTAKPKAGSRAKREYYSPNDFFEALADGSIQLIQPEQPDQPDTNKDAETKA